jgi:hypothetical protein
MGLTRPVNCGSWTLSPAAFRPDLVVGIGDRARATHSGDPIGRQTFLGEQL